MGKLVTFMAILIFVDLFFLATGQLTLDSPTSIIAQAISDPEGIQDSNFWLVLVTGLSGLAIVGGVIAGLVTRSSDIAIFFTMAGTLALLIGDYIVIFSYLRSLNSVLASMAFIAFIIIFTFIIIEWGRGKD